MTGMAKKAGKHDCTFVQKIITLPHDWKGLGVLQKLSQKWEVASAWPRVLLRRQTSVAEAMEECLCGSMSLVGLARLYTSVLVINKSRQQNFMIFISGPLSFLANIIGVFLCKSICPGGGLLVPECVWSPS